MARVLPQSGRVVRLPQMRCRECAAETAAAAQFCVRCGAPGAAQPPLIAGPGAADEVSDAVAGAAPMLPEPYVPGAGGKVPAQIRWLVRAYAGVAWSAFAGGWAWAIAGANVIAQHNTQGDLGVTAAWALFGLAIVFLVQRIRFSRLLRRPRAACAATVIASRPGGRTLTLHAPCDRYRPELMVRPASWTPRQMLQPGEKVTVYGRADGTGSLLVSSPPQGKAFLGTGTRQLRPPSHAEVRRQFSAPAPNLEAGGAVLAEWVESKGFAVSLRSYERAEVDAFLDAIRDTFLGVRKPPVTSDEVRDKQFSTYRLWRGPPGYDRMEVDAFLAEVEPRLAAWQPLTMDDTN